MKTKGEQFAGVTVALVTPFRGGEVDYDGSAQAGRLARRAGHRLPGARRHHRRVADARPRRARAASSPPSSSGAAAASRSWPAPAPTARARRIRLTKFAKKAGADGALHGRPVLQQADAGRLLPPLRRRRRGRGPADRPVQHPRPHRLEHPAGDDRPAGRACRASSPSRRRPARWTRRRRSLSLCDLTILSGDDSLTLPLMSIGGRGVVSVVGNIVPRDMKALVAAFDAGQDRGGAARGTASCSRCAATCSAWRPTRSRSRRR